MSPCGTIDAKTLVEEYIKAEYDGIYITDHLFFENSLNKYSGHTLKEVVDNHYKGYEAVLNAADGRIKVFCGAELRIEKNTNDYLIYGVDKSFFYENDLISMNINEVYETVRKYNGLLIQAHPFRNKMEIIDPALLDGIEVYNGNYRQVSRNSFAHIWADTYNLLKLSGSDFHKLEDLARGGIMTPVKIESEKAFADVIRSKNYSLIETV